MPVRGAYVPCTGRYFFDANLLLYAAILNIWRRCVIIIVLFSQTIK